MADVELLIKIPDSKLWSLKNEPIKENFNMYELASYIDKGTPLPKGHGDLVDKNTLEGHYVCSINLDGACVLKCDCKDCSSGVYQLYDDIDKIPIVVKADKESE